MAYLNKTLTTLLKEAQFTKEMLGAGVTQIRAANYATKGIYFQAFTSLSTGLERIGKLCLMLDHYIETGGKFPSFDYMKKEIGHKLNLLYQRSQEVIDARKITLGHYQDLSNPIHKSITKVLHDFAEGDRYSNVNLLVGSRQTNDPIAAWAELIDCPLFDLRVSKMKKARITENASKMAKMMGEYTFVLHTSESGGEITNLEEASILTGVYEAVAPYRQLYVLHVIRYWTELLSKLETISQKIGREDIPFFSELFGAFYNDDSYFRTRKTWDKI